MAVVISQAAPVVAAVIPLSIAKPKEGAYVEVPHDKSAADVFVAFNGSGGDVGGQPWRMAFWIEDAANAQKHGQVNLLDKIPTEDYALQNIPEGSYRVRAVLWMPNADAQEQPKKPDQLLGDSGTFKVLARADVAFNVKRFEDFSPAYDYKEVQPWNRVPTGLEITMDMSGGGGKKARIPQTWQWDAVVNDKAEPSGRRTIRVEVQADATFEKMLRQAGLDPTAWEAVWQQFDAKREKVQFERVMDVGWTAQQADLFRYQKDIAIRPKGAAVGTSE